MKKWVSSLMGVFMLVGISFAQPPKTPPGQIKKVIKKVDYELVERAFQINFGMGASLIDPAGFVVADLYPEFYVIKGLSLGFNFVAIPVMERDAWVLAIDFMNIKYTWIPKTFPRLQPYLRMGWGIGIGGIREEGTEDSFDWVLGSGFTYWITDNIGVGTDMTSHLFDEGTIFTWIYGVRWKMGF